MQAAASKSVETLPLGTTRHNIDDGKIVVVTGTGSMARESIDEWAMVMADTIHTNASAGKSVYLLCDISNRGQGFTPYARQKTEILYNNVPEGTPIFVAVLFTANVLSAVIALFLQRLVIRKNLLEVRVFNEHEAAVHWLREMKNNEQWA